MDVGEDSSASDGGADERVELLVSANGELEMTRGDTLDAEILGGVTCFLDRQRRSHFLQTKEDEPASSRTSAVRYSRMAEA